MLCGSLKQLCDVTYAHVMQLCDCSVLMTDESLIPVRILIFLVSIASLKQFDDAVLFVL